MGMAFPRKTAASSLNLGLRWRDGRPGPRALTGSRDGTAFNLRFAADLIQPLTTGGAHRGTPGHPADTAGFGDHQLGQRLAAQIAARGGARFEAAPLLSQVQDWLGADTALLVPMRDLLQRPAFRSLFSGEAASVQLGRRDALLADLASTYTPAVLHRLALVIDGCLGLPAGTPAPSLPASTPGPGPVTGPPSSWGSPPQAHASVPAWMAQPSSYPPPQTSTPAQGQPPSYGPGHSQGYGPSQGHGASQGYGAPPGPGPAAGPYAASAYGPPAGYRSTPAAAGNRGGGNALTALLIVLVALLVGGVLAGLGWLLLLNRPSFSPISGGSSAPPPPAKPAPTSPAATAPSPPQPPTDPTVAAPAETPSGAWGNSTDYKFGRLPGGDYPNSCAFSRTDEAGQKTIDKSQVEYWACRDIGGDAERGYNVAWADGKQTTYTFSNDGSGAVVGTNGSSYPMSWRNDNHHGSDIIVISHQDGATTWIPGHVK